MGLAVEREREATDWRTALRQKGEEFILLQEGTGLDEWCAALRGKNYEAERKRGHTTLK